MAVMAELASRGEDPSDTNVLGYELARQLVHRFAGFDYGLEGSELHAALEARISEERSKTSTSQGALASARDALRLAKLLGWLNENGMPTQIGRGIASGEIQGDLLDEVIRASWLEMSVEDARGVSHPMKLLLRLVGDMEFAGRQGMEAALAAANDSDEEYERVRALSQLPREVRAMAYGAATDASMDNAIKVLPKVAEELGFIELAGGVFRLTDLGREQVVGAPDDAGEPAPAGRGRRRAMPWSPAERDNEDSELGAVAIRAAAEQREAAQRLLERSRRHERLVDSVARLIGRASLHYHPQTYDLLGVPVDDSLPILLWEAKTVDGDEAKQSRLALSQLAYYEYFEVRPSWPGREVVRLAVFDGAIDRTLCDFLETEKVAAFRVSDGELVPLNSLAECLFGLLHELDDR